VQLPTTYGVGLFGSGTTYWALWPMSVLPPLATVIATCPAVAKGHKLPRAPQQITSLFDDVVGEARRSPIQKDRLAGQGHSPICCVCNRCRARFGGSSGREKEISSQVLACARAANKMMGVKKGVGHRASGHYRYLVQRSARATCYVDGSPCDLRNLPRPGVCRSQRADELRPQSARAGSPGRPLYRSHS